MKGLTITAGFASVLILPPSHAASQVDRDGVVALFREVYDTISTLLPPGPRAVVLLDRYGTGREQSPSPGDLNGRAQANRDFALDMGLRYGPLSEVRPCEASWDCRFLDHDIVATVSFAVVSIDDRAALAAVTTRYFIESSALRERFDAAWQAVAFREVRLTRPEGEWRMESVILRGES